ncbi:MAG: hypothetical protein LBN99_01205 [Oscillospiraceae bacterium]|jgi:hypothetical protein|nr:hypothetical protein [Oscillospiraceae bacterium]
MSRTKKLTFSGVMSAGAVVLLIVGRLMPTGQPGFAAVASLFAAAAAIECGELWGLAVWGVSGALALILLPGSASVWLYSAFFGYYPVVKLFAERRLPTVPAWIVKLAAYAVSATVITLVWRPYKPIVAIVGAAAFVVFDIGYSKLIVFYRARISRKR